MTFPDEHTPPETPAEARAVQRYNAAIRRLESAAHAYYLADIEREQAATEARLAGVPMRTLSALLHVSSGKLYRAWSPNFPNPSRATERALKRARDNGWNGVRP